MAIEVELPDGSIVEFPEGTDNATMERALVQYGKPQAWQPTKRSLADIRKEGKGFDPTEGQTFGQNAAQGFGRSLVKTGDGLGQLFGNVSEQDVQRRREVDAPLMDTWGGEIGNFAGEVAQVAAPIPGAAVAKGAAWAGRAAPYAGAAARGALYSGAQGTTEGESRGVNTVVGGVAGVAGQGLASGAGRLATRAKDALTAPVQESIRLAKAAGIPLHLSQVTNSKALKTLSSALNYLPFSGAGKAGRNQQEAFNKAASRSFGFEDINAPQLSDDVMQSARDKFNAGYRGVFAGKRVQLDPQAMKDLFSLHGSVGDMLEADQASVVRKQIERIIKNADEDGFMPGEVYQNLRSKIREKFADGSKLGNEVMEARKVLDDAAKRALGPDDAAKLDKLNGGYANYKTVQESLKQVEGSKGNVKPAALWNLVKNGSTDEMRKLAQIGQNVLKDPIPDSGTASRDLVYRALGMGGGAGAASAMGFGAMLAPAAKFAAGGIVGGRLLNSRVAEKALGHGRPTAGLAQLMKPAPRALPVAAPSLLSMLGLDVTGGRKATQADMANDEEVVRRFRQQQRR